MRERAPLVVVPYDPRWPLLYKEVSEAIKSVAGDVDVTVEHVGSTAVPGMRSKPILDILVGVRDFPHDAQRLMAPLTSLGFAYVAKPWTDRYFLRRGEWGNGTHHVHIVEYGGDEWERLILFRGFLRSHPVDATSYADLKQRFAEMHGLDRPRYTQAKSDFIEQILLKAREHGRCHSAPQSQ